MVKELEDAPHDEVAVLLDARAAAGEPARRAFDVQVRAAGSILRVHALRGRRSVLTVTGKVPAGPSGDLARQRVAVWRSSCCAAAEPDRVGAVRAVPRPRSVPAAQAAELVVVTSSLTTGLTDAGSSSGSPRAGSVSLVLVQASSFASGASRPATRRFCGSRRPGPPWRSCGGETISAAKLTRARRGGGGRAWLGRWRSRPAWPRSSPGTGLGWKSRGPAAASCSSWQRWELRRRSCRRWRWRLAGSAVALLVAGSVALDVARPYDVGKLAHRAATGFLDFYDVLVPFDGAAHPRMHGVILLAVFAFSLLAALAIASRRPVAATVVLIAGRGVAGDDPPRRRRPRPWGGAADRRARPDRAGLAAAEPRSGPGPDRHGARLAGARRLELGRGRDRTSSRTGKERDLYTRPDNAVSVDYVWRSNYDGIHFPSKRTKVLTVHAPAHAAYWRATTLNAFVRDHWEEELSILRIPPQSTIDLSGDPMLPAAAGNRTRWTRADVKVEALRDTHLVGSEQPVAYDTGSIPDVSYAWSGPALCRPRFRAARHTRSGATPRSRPRPNSLARVPTIRSRFSMGPTSRSRAVRTCGRSGRRTTTRSCPASSRTSPARPLPEAVHEGPQRRR